MNARNDLLETLTEYPHTISVDTATDLLDDHATEARATLTAQLDQARRIAVDLENEVARLRDQLAEAGAHHGIVTCQGCGCGRNAGQPCGMCEYKARFTELTGQAPQ